MKGIVFNCSKIRYLSVHSSSFVQMISFKSNTKIQLLSFHKLDVNLLYQRWIIHMRVFYLKNIYIYTVYATIVANVTLD